MKQTISILLLLGLAVLGVYAFFDGCGERPPEKITPAVSLQKQAGDIEKEYVMKITKLTRENDSLKADINSRKKMLMLSRQLANTSKNEVIRLIVKEKTVRDTVLKVVYCDSLQTKVDSLIIQVATVDSLCEEQHLCYARQVQEKDSVIAAAQKSYLDLKSVTGSSFEEQKSLADELNAANSKLRRRAGMNRLLSGGLLILGGIVASNLVLHR
jgi:hypothetical protein